MSQNQIVTDLTYQNYDQELYFIESTPVDIHPIDRSVMPAPFGATLKTFPTPIPTNKWPKFVNDEWVFVDSFVGTVFWNSDHEQCAIARHETPVPHGSFLSDPGPKLEKVVAETQLKVSTAYYDALSKPAPFTTEAGILAFYQHDPASIQAIVSALSGFIAIGNVPEGYFWKSADNERVAFTLVDLNGLASAMTSLNFELFTKFQDYKDLLAAATTVDEALAVVWTD